MVSTNFSKLKKIIPNIKTLVENKIINIISLKKNAKTPLGNWKVYQNEKYPTNKLKNHDGNYGIILGYNKENTDYWLAGIDIDGFSISEKELKKSINVSNDEKNILEDLSSESIVKNKNQTRQDLFNLLKDLKDVLIVKTANNGYHIYYWTKRDFNNKFIENIYYPKDYDIKILRNKSITYFNKHIEHYTEARQFVFPPSVIKQNKNESSYEFVSSSKDIEEFFENPKPKENILIEIKEIVQKNSKGYIYREHKKVEKANNIKRNRKTTKYSNSIKLSSSLIKTKIHNPDIRKELLNNILKAGYVQGNMNNLGYILICNFRRHGLSENEIFNIFRDLQIENHDLNKVKSWIKDKYKVDLDSIDFEEYAGLGALMKEIEVSAPEDQQNFLKDWFTNFFYDVITKLKKKPQSQNDLIKLADFLEKEYNIVKTFGKKEPIYYYYDNEIKTYKQINHHELGIKVFNEYGLRLPDAKYNTVLTSCQILKEIDSYYIEFKSCFINIKTMKVISKKGNDILTDKKFYLEDLNRFLEYNPDVKLVNTEDDETLTEKTLKEILIPKDDPNNLDYYIDYLQRLGSNIQLNHKLITGYLGGGDNGKSILNWYGSIIYNNLYSGIKPEEFKKNFNQNAFRDKHFIAIDELDNNSFNGILPDIKRFRGGGIPVDDRDMYSPDYARNKDYGMLWMFSNKVPTIPFSDKALFESMDIIKLPNKFVDKENLNKYRNTYIKDRFIKNKLIKDFDGFCWLINVAIKEYKKMNAENQWFILNQSADETIAIIHKNDYMLNFLGLYTEIDNYSKTPNKEILNKYITWIEANKFKIKTDNHNKISKEIGNKLKELYCDDLKVSRPQNKAHYNIKLKKDMEVNKTKLEINEDILSDNYYIIDNLDSNEKIVYNAIKEGINTYEHLNKEYPDLKLIEILNKLKDMELIIESEYYSLF